MKIILIAAITIDGKIAKYSGHTVDWTSKKDKQFFRDETKKAGVVIFGSTTYRAIGRPMPQRLNIIMTRNPNRFSDEEEKGLIEFTNESPHAIIARLTTQGYETAVIGGGSEIYSLFLKSRLINEIYLTIAPRIFGQGVNLFSEIDLDDLTLELFDVSRLGAGEVLLKYHILL
jgi:dihydrofolate reductase